jgi:hypothetical protein
MLRQAQHERKMVVTANTAPIALSTVEGCAQSPRFGWLIAYGLWRMVRMFQLYSISCQPYAKFARLASEIFLSSLQTELNNC